MGRPQLQQLQRLWIAQRPHQGLVANVQVTTGLPMAPDARRAPVATATAAGRRREAATPKMVMDALLRPQPQQPHQLQGGPQSQQHRRPLRRRIAEILTLS